MLRKANNTILTLNCSFKEIAELVTVCWLEVRGLFDCKVLSPGTEYTISFRVKLRESRRGVNRIFGHRATIL